MKQQNSKQLWLKTVKQISILGAILGALFGLALALVAAYDDYGTPYFADFSYLIVWVFLLFGTIGLLSDSFRKCLNKSGSIQVGSPDTIIAFVGCVRGIRIKAI